MSYSTLGSQRSMVFDTFRNQRYAEAMRNAITPDSVVLDLGAGLGILGLIAAAMGAKRVYMVEPEPVVNLAKEIAHINGLADRIVVLEGNIEDIKLPEKVDLIISVFTGNLLFSEDLLPSLFHARDRYLKPGGRLIPDRAELVMAPVSCPQIHAKYVDCWSGQNMGLMLSPARRFAVNEILWLRRDEIQADQLSPGLTMTGLDFYTATHADCDASASCQIQSAAVCHALLGWTRIKLGNDWLETGLADPEVHWTPALLPLDPPLTFEKGENVELSLRRPAYGDWIWSVKTAVDSRRHSSFLSRVDGLSRLRKTALDSRAGLDQKGELALHVLEWMKQGLSNREIALKLSQTEELHPDFDEALRLVQALAARYARQ